MAVSVELLLCLLAGVVVAALVAVHDRVRARRSSPVAILREEPFVEDAWHCPQCQFLALLKRSAYGREWRANLLAAIDRGAPAHGGLEHVMREAPPLTPRVDLLAGWERHDARAGGGIA